MDIPYTTVNGRKYLTIDGVRLLRRALGLPDMDKHPRDFPGDFNGWKEYLKAKRKETLEACHPGMLEEFEAE